jgi:hypothetical protein
MAVTDLVKDYFINAFCAMDGAKSQNIALEELAANVCF